MGMLEDLVIPVNPDYTFAEDPDGQEEYANPVTVSNQVVALSNAASKVAAIIVNCNKQLVEARQVLAVAEDAMEDFEQELLGRFQASTADRKSNKLLEAYIRRVAFEQGHAEEHRALRDKHRDAAHAVARLEVKVDSSRQVWQVLKLKGELAQTYLSFKKHEYEHHK